MRRISELPIKDIVERTGITHKSIRNWETGKNAPSIVNINELLKVYGFSLDQLDMSIFYENTGRDEGTATALVKL